MTNVRIQGERFSDKQISLLRKIINGEVKPSGYVNNERINWFDYAEDAPCLYGNLYFTLTIRSLVKRGFLYRSELQRRHKLKCKINGIDCITFKDAFDYLPTRKALDYRFAFEILTRKKELGDDL